MEWRIPQPLFVRRNKYAKEVAGSSQKVGFQAICRETLDQGSGFAFAFLRDAGCKVMMANYLRSHSRSPGTLEACAEISCLVLGIHQDIESMQKHILK